MDTIATARFSKELQELVGADNVKSGEPMALHTTFKIGGPADWFVTPLSNEHVARVIALCRDYGMRYWIMGLGSNLLVSDAGLRGVVIQLADRFARIERDGTRIIAQAGASNTDVARVALDAGLAGYEFASGIPGSIGGAAIMNAGAYGGEFKDVAVRVTCLSPEGSIVVLSREEASWSYRHSSMMECGLLVLEAVLELRPDDMAAIKARMKDYAHRRSSKQPLEYPSAGSTFKRPDGYYVGPMIEDLGLKGFSVGGAQVSEKHAGFVINRNGASAADVLGLIEHIKTAVYEHYGVTLQPEVRLWGFESAV